MDLQTLINQRITENTYTLEIYTDEVEENIFLEATIHTPVVNFVTDIDCNRFKFPNTILVIDIEAFVPNLNLEFNIPDSVQQIIIKNKNIINKNLMELFPENVKYRYVQCNLEDKELNILINQRYKKYFNIEPRYATNRISNQKIMNNMIYSRFHSNIIDSIRNYEQRVAQGKEFCKIVKEELVAAALHPNKIKRILQLTNNHYMNLDNYI
uniref:Uncharacterized protein n=1 Tax=viral metagenome TaxID=1070528 RepID=A0A6C0D9U5_9ZZZZ